MATMLPTGCYWEGDVIRPPAYCIKSMRLLVVRIAVNDLLREM